MRSRTDPVAANAAIAAAEHALAGGDDAHALIQLERATTADPYDDRAALMAARIELRLGTPVRAAHLAARALDARPFHPEALAVLGRACVDAGELETGTALLQLAVRWAPALGGARRTLDAARQRQESTELAAALSDDPSRSARLPWLAIRLLLDEREPTLSACVLLRDGQEPSLEPCLAALRAVAAERIVIDGRTGHGGRAPLLRPAAGVHWVPGEPTVPGSAAHDPGLRRARGDWVLVVDAAEVLALDSVAALKRTLGDPRALGLSAVVRHPARGVTWRSVRLARNAPGVRLAGDRLTREVVALEQRWGLEIREAPLVLVRVGAPRTGDPGNARRVAPVTLEDARLGHCAADVETLLDRARGALEAGELAAARELARQARAQLERDPARARPLELEAPVTIEGCCLLRLGEPDALDALIRGYHARHAPSSATLCLEGAAALGRGEAQRAAGLLVRALDLEQQPSYAPAPPETRGTALLDLFGAALVAAGELGEARRVFEVSARRDPNGIEAQLGIAGVLHAQGQREAVLTRLARLLEVADAPARARIEAWSSRAGLDDVRPRARPRIR